jgi:hypothetical protein
LSKVFSKMSTGMLHATYQEILAGFVVRVKESEAQWYSIKPLQNAIPSFANLLEACRK